MPLQSHEVSRVKSAGRALWLLDLVSERGALRFQDVVDSGLPKSSAYALLNTLVDSGWLEYSKEKHQYQLGLHAWQVGQAYDGHRGLLQATDAAMDLLVERLGETVQLARLEGIENVYIGLRQSPHPMRLASSIGMRLHSHATGIGKALLSTLSEDEARRRLASMVLPRLTERTTTGVDDILRLLQKVRDLGFATDDEEFVEGCRCVAVPLVTEAETGIAAALSVTMPTQRTNASWPHALYPALQEARTQVRTAMGLSA